MERINENGEMDLYPEGNQIPLYKLAYMELIDVVVAGVSDECKSTSDIDRPIQYAYLTVNF